MRLLCALGLFLALLHVTSCLLIGAFNIQTFGVTKSGIKEGMKKAEIKKSKEVMETITKIVRLYDIILIQEVLDPDGKVTQRLMELVNKDISINSPHHFNNISSEPLGRRSHKERYLFLYKNETVTVEDSFQYTGYKADVFDRPPFVVKFSSTQTQTDVEEFVLIPIHASPLTAVKAAEKTTESEYVYNSTVEELDALVDVVEEAKEQWENNNIMVLGDFNADGTYVTKTDWDKIRLFTNTDFHWLIKDGVDTTVAAKSSNTYDRIVVTTEMEKGVVKDSAEVFDFKTYYNLKAQAEKVSDHFPVQVRLKPKEELGKRRALKSDVELEPKPSKRLKV